MYQNLIRGITFLTIILLFSCSEERHKGSFTESEIAWLVYELGDTIPFFSEQTGVMNFVVTQKSKLSRVSREFPIEAEILLESQSNDYNLKIYLLKDTRSFKKYVRLNYIYRSLDIIEPLEIWETELKTFSDVYEIQEDTSRNELQIHTAWFNKEHGFLKLEDKDGNTFIRTAVDDNELSALISEN